MSQVTIAEIRERWSKEEDFWESVIAQGLNEKVEDHVKLTKEAHVLLAKLIDPLLDFAEQSDDHRKTLAAALREMNYDLMYRRIGHPGFVKDRGERYQ